MLTNTTLLARELAVISSVEEFCKNIDPKSCASVLDDLFFDFVGSESSDDTPTENRARVVHAYRMMKFLIDQIESNQETEVCDD